jgi:hypothetical protein
MERRVVTARIVGVPTPEVAVWVSVDDPDVAGDLDHPPEHVRRDDRVVLSVERDRFRWLVRDLIDHVPARSASTTTPRVHAHPARPPGTVLIAWLPFSREDDAPGKHRPCVVLRSTDPTMLRVRPLYDADSAHVRRHGGVQLTGWKTAGLDKASVAVDPVEVPIARVAQTLGEVNPYDRNRLGIGDR